MFPISPAAMRWFTLALACIALLFAVGCQRAGSAATPSSPPEVSVARPLSRSVVDFDEFSGRVSAIESVEIRPRVSGYLKKVHFKEGQLVQTGDVLMTIDPEFYAVEVARRTAELRRVESALALSKENETRGSRLVKTSAISQEEYETLAKTRNEAEASVAAASAALAAARLELGYTTVRSPIRGRTGRALVTAGNLVTGGGTGATLLTTVVSQDPIHVLFDADERAYLRYQQPQEKRVNGGARYEAKPIQLALADETTFSRSGTMDFVDNRIDAATGTIRVRAVFPNNNGRELTPGMFARVRVQRDKAYEALLIQDQAIATDLGRRVVMTVDADNTVRAKPVEVGALHEGLRVIRSGLAADDWVIVNGLQRAQPNAKVTPQRKGMESEAAAAASSR